MEPDFRKHSQILLEGFSRAGFPWGLPIFHCVAMPNELTLLVSSTVQLTQSLRAYFRFFELENKIALASTVDGSKVVYYLRTVYHVVRAAGLPVFEFELQILQAL